MEIDAKTIAGIVVAAFAGGGSGFATVQVDVARLEARLAGLEGVFRDRVSEAQEDHNQTRELLSSGLETTNERISIAVEALQERLDRMERRKMDAP